jgi:hypothetical protein
MNFSQKLEVGIVILALQMWRPWLRVVKVIVKGHMASQKRAVRGLMGWLKR